MKFGVKSGLNDVVSGWPFFIVFSYAPGSSPYPGALAASH
jgi:hypothetical protein